MSDLRVQKVGEGNKGSLRSIRPLRVPVAQHLEQACLDRSLAGEFHVGRTQGLATPVQQFAFAPCPGIDGRHVLAHAAQDVQARDGEHMRVIGHAKMIEEEVPGYINCLFYLSGPRSMVIAYEKTLAGLGVPGTQIKKDFFPGFV